MSSSSATSSGSSSLGDCCYQVEDLELNSDEQTNEAAMPSLKSQNQKGSKKSKAKKTNECLEKSQKQQPPAPGGERRRLMLTKKERHRKTKNRNSSHHSHHHKSGNGQQPSASSFKLASFIAADDAVAENAVVCAGDGESMTTADVAVVAATTSASIKLPMVTAMSLSNMAVSPLAVCNKRKRCSQARPSFILTKVKFIISFDLAFLAGSYFFFLLYLSRCPMFFYFILKIRIFVLLQVMAPQR
jgi:hypothetical protein